ncbi:MAG: carboxylate--amine ligase [Bryobacteraceae bacterium]
MFDRSTPVLVVRCSRPGGLAVTRTLGRLGVPVFHLDAHRTAPAFYSRYSHGRFHWDLEAHPPQESLRFLARAAKTIGRRAILIPTSDGTAVFAARYAAALEEHFELCCPAAELAETLTDKRRMQVLASAAGLPTALTMFPRSLEEALTHLDHVRLPLLFKGVTGRSLAPAGGRRMFLVGSREQLVALYRAHRPGERNLMLQQYIPGGEDGNWMFNGYFDRAGRCRIGFTGRKLRQYPAYCGLTSLGVLADNPTVRDMAVNFLTGIGYQGPVDMDFRFDGRDGTYKLLDVNPRMGATFRLFVDDNGNDVIRAMYLDMTGQDIRSAAPCHGRKLLIEDSDLVSSARYFLDGRLSLREWFRSHRGVDERGIFAADDPVPAFWTALRNLGALCRKPFRTGAQNAGSQAPGFTRNEV